MDDDLDAIVERFFSRPSRDFTSADGLKVLAAASGYLRRVCGKYRYRDTGGDDLHQHVMEMLLAKADSIHAKSCQGLLAWCKAALRFATVDCWRREQRFPLFADSLPEGRDDNTEIENCETPEQLVEEKRVRQRLRQAIAELRLKNPNMATVVDADLADGCPSPKELASLLHCSIDNIYQLHRRGMNWLHTRLRSEK